MFVYLVLDLSLLKRERSHMRKVLMTATFCFGMVLTVTTGGVLENGNYYDLRAAVLAGACIFLAPLGSSLVLLTFLAMAAWADGVGGHRGLSSVAMTMVWVYCTAVLDKRYDDWRLPGRDDTLQRMHLIAVGGAIVVPTVKVTGGILTVYGWEGLPELLLTWPTAQVWLAFSLVQSLAMAIPIAVSHWLRERLVLKAKAKSFETRINKVLSVFPDTISVQDSEGTFLEVWAEGQVVNKVGLSESLIVGKTVYELYQPEFAQKRLRLIKECLETQKQVQAVFEATTANEKKIYTEMRLVPMGDNTVLTMARDIAEAVQLKHLVSSRTQMLELMLAGTKDLLALVTEDDKLVCVSASACSAPHCSGTAVFEWVAPKYHADVRRALERVRAQAGKSVLISFALREPVDEPCWMEANFFSVWDSDKAEVVVFLNSRDVTAKKSLEMFHSVGLQAFESLSDAIVVIDDQEGRIKWANSVFHRITGYTYPESRNQPLDGLLQSAASKSVMPSTVDLVVGGAWSGEFLSKTKDGRWFTERRQVTYFEDDFSGQTLHVVVLRDISLEREQESRVQRMATHDSLTGLLSRAAFVETLRERIPRYARSQGEAGSGLAVLTLSLVRFNEVVRSLGREAADSALRQVAHKLSFLTPEWASLARVEQCDFALMSPFQELQTCEDLAEQLLGLFKEPFNVAGREIYLAANVGISSTFSPLFSAEALMHESHLAVTEINLHGERQVNFYSEGISERSEKSLLIESQLRRSVLSGGKELFLMYQPKVCLVSGKVVGLEALCRWTSPLLGVVSPYEFIPVAERSALIGELGVWVFTTACKQIASWVHEGFSPLPVAVNLSVRQLRDDALPDTLQQISRRYGVLPSLIELEVTETDVLDDVEHAISCLSRLRRLGFRVALDDFGTGYSSFAYLQKLPLDILKLDKVFVQELGLNHENNLICRAILTLAHGLGLYAVAEGVETEAQRDFLVKEGCDAMQGHLFSKALLPEDAASLLAGALPPTKGKPKLELI